MADAPNSPVPNERGRPITLSTGQTVRLPLSTTATIRGAVFDAPRTRVRELLPDGLTPVGLTPRTAAVTLLSVEYHRVGVDGIEPYDEFAVLFPAVHRSRTTLPLLSLSARATSGYVWYLPVTTESARALGVDVWGHPKVVGDITHEDSGSRRRTTVEIDGERVVTVEVDRPPSVHLRNSGATYTVKEQTLVCNPTEVDGEIGAWPYSTRVSVTLGDHPRADTLRELGLGGRALARLSIDGEATFFPGSPVRSA